MVKLSGYITNINVFKKGLNYFFKFMFGENSTMKRKINLISALIQWKILERERLSSYPIKVNIDPGNICNLHCKACPTGVGLEGRNKGLINWGTYKKIIDEIGDYLFEVDLYSWGEPFLHRQIFDMVEYANQKKITTIISSNFMVFNDEICEKIIKSQLSLLIVSLHGGSQESIDSYQVGTDFNKVINNMKKIVEMKNKLKSNKPFIQWRMVVTKYNEHEIEKVQKMAKEIGVNRLELAPYRCDMATEVLMSNERQFETAKTFLPKDEGYSMYNYSKKEKKNIKNDDCIWLFMQAAVNWNGSVSPCCAIWHEKFDFGNISEKPFLEIWNNEKYIAARRLNRKNYKPDPKLGLVCATCYKNQAQI